MQRGGGSAVAIVGLVAEKLGSLAETTLPPIHLNHSQGPETQNEFGI